MNEIFCPCGSKQLFVSCCYPFLNNKKWPRTPEALMRSRYSAFVFMQVEYLIETTHPKTKKYYSEKTIRQWAERLKWIDLTIHEANDSTVKFNARYMDENGMLQEHKELSTFEKANGKWYFLDGVDWD